MRLYQRKFMEFIKYNTFLAIIAPFYQEKYTDIVI